MSNEEVRYENYLPSTDIIPSSVRPSFTLESTVDLQWEVGVWSEEFEVQNDLSM